jgi:hypothetical protein
VPPWCPVTSFNTIKTHLAWLCLQLLLLLLLLHLILLLPLLPLLLLLPLQVMLAAGGSTQLGAPVVSSYLNPEKRFAVIEFRTVEECSNAMALDGILCQVGGRRGGGFGQGRGIEEGILCQVGAGRRD